MARPVARRIYGALLLSDARELSPACLIDFALDEDFDNRWDALKNAISAGATDEDFDAALGDGKRLTIMVKKFGGSDVDFGETSWDVISMLEE